VPRFLLASQAQQEPKEPKEQSLPPASLVLELALWLLEPVLADLQVQHLGLVHSKRLLPDVYSRPDL
jgi:hypothetical protein